MENRPPNPFRDHIDPDNVIGYQEQRGKLADAISKEANFIILEGEIGAGKTTLIEEAMKQYPGIYVDVGTVQNIRQQINRRMNLYEKIISKPEPFEWLSKDARQILYLDENKFLEPEALLHIKQATSKNSRLTTVIALTPRQVRNVLDDYTELERRIHLGNRIHLPGLPSSQLRELITSAKSDIPMEEAVVERVLQQSNLPQAVKILCEKLYDYARDKHQTSISNEVFQNVLQEAKQDEKEAFIEPAMVSPVVSPTPSGLETTPLEEKVLEIIQANPGLKRGEVAVKLGSANPNSVGNALTSLSKKYLIQKRSARYFPYGTAKSKTELVS